MIIRHLTIRNFGPFCGEHRIDVAPETAKKSVVLIGGDNGFGKTTLLNSIKLCLYGKRASELWGGASQQAYRQYITKLFNNAAFADTEREMSLELGLVIWENKIPAELTVRRTYHLTDTRAFQYDGQEELQVFRDGKPLPVRDIQAGDSDVGNDYDTLLRVLIPAHFAQFYFFDAEKMRDVFSRPKPEAIAQAVRDLLGLSVYERLAQDMVVYRRTKLPDLYGKHSQRQADLKAKVAEHASIEAELLRIQELIEEHQEQLTELNRLIEEKEADFRRHGGLHQDEVDKLKGEKISADAEYDALTKQLKEAMTGQIAACFLLTLREPILKRLEQERISREHDLKREGVTAHITRLQDQLFGDSAPAPIPPLSLHQQDFYRERLEEEINNLFVPPPQGYEKDRWFDLREQEVVEINSSLDDAARFSSGALRDMIETKNRVFNQRERIRDRLSSMGDTRITQDLADEIRAHVEERGKVNAQLEQAGENRKAVEQKLSELAGQITDLEKQCGKSARGKEREDFSKRVEAVINDYLHKASTEKADDIEKHLNRLFLKMANCRDEIRHIQLDRQSYALSILGKDGRERPIDTGLSEGQAQVLALAFVGALAKASGRILPTIIDTPLGRLDVNHRRDVTEHFFIGFSPQTILLSTPTEINNCVYDGVPLKLLDNLRPHVSHAYTIERNGKGSARIVDGYFGNKF